MLSFFVNEDGLLMVAYDVVFAAVLNLTSIVIDRCDGGRSVE
jgi:hypothetical protein